MTTSAVEISPDLTMAEVLRRVPAAQRALFQRYHVGGCSSCGFQPTDTLAKVCKDHNLLDVNGVIQTILSAHEADLRMQVDRETLDVWRRDGQPLRILDVRMPDEREDEPCAWAEPLDYDDPEKYMKLDKGTRLVFACASGHRSLDVASYFAGHGFAKAYSLRGGLSR